MGIFTPRENYKPFEYPEVMEFVDGINKTFWTHQEVDFTADIQDFKNNLNEKEQEAIKRSLLGIAQIEVAVKTFWGNLYNHFPKPEFNVLGSTFAHNECYDDKTEVLTNTGFKLFKDLKEDDKIATLYMHDKDSNFIESSIVYQDYTNKVEQDYDGIMHHYENDKIDLLVTPNHRMLVFDANSKDTIKYELSKDMPTGPLDSIIDITEQGFVAAAEKPNMNYSINNFNILSYLLPLIGHFNEDGLYSINVNKESRLSNRIDKLMFYNKDFNNLKSFKIVHSNRIATYVGDFKYAIKNNNYNIKDINQHYKNLKTFSNLDLRQEGSYFLTNLFAIILNETIDGILNGDNLLYASTKEGLELLKILCIHFRHSYKELSYEEVISGNYEDAILNIQRVTGKRDLSNYLFLKINKDFTFTYPYRKDVPYKGKIYCVTVPNGNMVVRRNDKPVISGNSIHSEAYSRLLEVLGFDNEFEKALDIPIFKEKVDLSKRGLAKDKSILEKLFFFALVIENASLFSQFATILSFTRFKGYMKNTSNIIAWTSLDEDMHKNAGIYLINKIKEERATLLGEESFVDEEFIALIKEYMVLEEKFIDWIFEKGELEFFTKKNLLDFMKYRVDLALQQIGMNKIFNITDEEYKPMKWFEEEIYSNSLDDFFAKRPVDYTKHDKSFTGKDLF